MVELLFILSGVILISLFLETVFLFLYEFVFETRKAILFSFVTSLITIALLTYFELIWSYGFVLSFPFLCLWVIWDLYKSTKPVNTQKETPLK